MEVRGVGAAETTLPASPLLSCLSNLKALKTVWEEQWTWGWGDCVTRLG